MSGADQKRHSPKSQEKSEQNFWHRPVAAGAQPVHNDQPQGNHRDQQGGNPGRHDLFRPADAAIPYEEEQDASHGGRFPVRGRRADASLPTQQRVTKHAHGNVAQSCQH